MTWLTHRQRDRLARLFRSLLGDIASLHSGEHTFYEYPPVWGPSLELVQYAIEKDGKVELDEQKPALCQIVFWPDDQHSITLFWAKRTYVPPTEQPGYPECRVCGSVVCRFPGIELCLDAAPRHNAAAAAEVQRLQEQRDDDFDIPF